VERKMSDDELKEFNEIISQLRSEVEFLKKANDNKKARIAGLEKKLDTKQGRMVERLRGIEGDIGELKKHHTSTPKTPTPTKNTPVPSVSKTTIPILGKSEWRQIGNVIYGGITYGTGTGHRVSLNSSGKSIAISSYKSDVGGSESGSVRIYNFNESSQKWTMVGNPIHGSSSGDHLGTSIALDSDGKTIAIGADQSDDNGKSSGHVRLFRLNEGGTNWNQLGQTIGGGKLR